MAIELECAGCKKTMGTVRDAKLRKGMVVYCQECEKKKHTMRGAMPDFMRGFFGTKLSK